MKQLSATLFMTVITGAILFAQGPPPGDAVGPGAFGPGPGPMGIGPGGPPITGAPYSGTEVIQMQRTLSDGNTIQIQQQAKIYRDSQGRTRTENTMTSPAGQTHTSILIFDPVAGYEARLDPQTSTVVKHSLPSPPSGHNAPPSPPNEPNASQLQTEDLGSNTISGLAVTGKQTTITIPAGAIGNAQSLQIVRQVWISTALKVPVLITTSDPRAGSSSMQLSNVSQSEPDPALFQIPSNYSVVTDPGPGASPGAPPFAQ